MSSQKFFQYQCTGQQFPQKQFILISLDNSYDFVRDYFFDWNRCCLRFLSWRHVLRPPQFHFNPVKNCIDIIEQLF